MDDTIQASRIGWMIGWVMIIPPKQQWSNWNLNIFFSISYEFMWYMNIIWISYEYHVNILKPCILIFDSSNASTRFTIPGTLPRGSQVCGSQPARLWGVGYDQYCVRGTRLDRQPPYPSHWREDCWEFFADFSDNFLTFYFWIFLMNINNWNNKPGLQSSKFDNWGSNDGNDFVWSFCGPRNANLRDLPITAGNTVGVALGAIELGCSCQVQQIKSSTCCVRGSFRNRSFCRSSPQLGGIRELVMILNLASLLILSLLLKEASSQSSLQDVFCSGWKRWRQYQIIAWHTLVEATIRKPIRCLPSLHSAHTW